MSRGRDSGAEISRVQSREVSKERGEGKSGAGVQHFTKKGFGAEKGMQVNPKSMKKDEF